MESACTEPFNWLISTIQKTLLMSDSPKFETATSILATEPQLVVYLQWQPRRGAERRCVFVDVIVVVVVVVVVVVATPEARLDTNT